MTSNIDIIERYAQEAGKDNPRMLHVASLNVYVGSRYAGWRGTREEERTIYSYGSHFPMARIMPDGDNHRGWWLVNGDRYSNSTSRHQADLRSALQRTGLPMLIVPFSALDRGGIDWATIKPAEILPDRYTWEPRVHAECPAFWFEMTSGAMPRHAYEDVYRNAHRLQDGRYAYEVKVHHLGSAVFTASRRSYESTQDRYSYISSFDENEPGFGLYFLAELPEGVHPQTVADALEALKPAEVKFAEEQGQQEILRQGDVFAISTWRETRSLPGPSRRSAYILGTNHMATEVRVEDGVTFARGYLRHRPPFREPEHRRVQLGDRKTWFRLIKNTVPEGRSWTIGGRVD